MKSWSRDVETLHLGFLSVDWTRPSAQHGVPRHATSAGNYVQNSTLLIVSDPNSASLATELIYNIDSMPTLLPWANAQVVLTRKRHMFIMFPFQCNLLPLSPHVAAVFNTKEKQLVAMVHHLQHVVVTCHEISGPFRTYEIGKMMKNDRWEWLATNSQVCWEMRENILQALPGAGRVCFGHPDLMSKSTLPSVWNLL